MSPTVINTIVGDYMKKIKKELFIQTCNASASMAKARVKYSEIEELMNFKTFVKYAKLWGCYKPNQAGKGISKNFNGYKIDLLEILDGKHPQYSTSGLHLRLIKELHYEEKCAVCKLTEWNGIKIPLDLDHIDGNNTNHKKVNLRLLCPNCHRQTDNFGSKNRAKMKKVLKVAGLEVRKRTDLKWEPFKIKVLESDIDFSKFGWVTKVSKVLNISPQKVNKWMKRYLPDFYENKCFKRNILMI